MLQITCDLLVTGRGSWAGATQASLPTQTASVQHALSSFLLAAACTVLMQQQGLLLPAQSFQHDS